MWNVRGESSLHDGFGIHMIPKNAAAKKNEGSSKPNTLVSFLVRKERKTFEDIQGQLQFQES